MNNTMKKVLTLVAAMVLAEIAVHAREISSAEAGKAAIAWARRDGGASGARLLSAGVADVRTTADDDGTPIFHVVRLPGGGVVVTSAESGVTPVVAFLESGDLQESDGNPLWKILRADMTLRTRQARTPSGSCASETAWANLLAANSGGARLLSAIPDASGLTDLRVAPLLSTTWNQGSNAANYYTPPNNIGDPDNYVCGCVALAGAEIANYWRFPTLSRPQVTNLCYLSGVSANYVSLGGFYDWSNMPADFSSLSSAQKRAVGRLCYDFGVATKMNWGPLPEGSGTLGILLGEAFRDVFGYASAVAYSHDGDVMPDALVERTVLANLDAQSPVALNLDGHTAVADGYGYASGTLYTHINLGWGGVGNVWYNLPEVEVNEGGGSYSSSILDGVVYNIHPTETGELLTGRVLDGNGDPVADATVTAFGSVSGGSQLVATATTDARGIYAFRVAGGRTWTVVATDGSLSGNCSVDVGLSASAACTERTPTGGRITLGVIGNSWGNDITLGAAGTSTILFVDAASGSDANDGRSWSTAKATIQAAIDIVEGSATTNAIVLVADGRYEPITATNNIPFSIHSVNGPEATVIDGSLQWARGVTNRCATLGTNATETATVLGGFTLVNGIPPNTNATSYVLSAGGGSLGGTVIDCILTNNAAKNGGGACYSVLQDCTVSGNVAKFGGGTYLGSLANCVVADNSSASSGGGIYGLNSTVVTNCTISGNRAGTFGGGVSASAATSLIGCTITNNAAGSNGGGCNSGTLSACLIAGNTATAMGGGTYDATALTRCTVTNNVAGTYGGGCYKGSLSFCIVTGNRAAKGGGTSSAALTDCTVAGNTASTSGGGVNGGSATRCGIVNNTATSNGGGSSGAVLDNCVVVHNGAGADGGGAANGALTNCTVYANTALNNGGGIYLASLANCIVWGNTAPQNPAVYAFSSTPCLNSCLDQVLTGDYNVGNIVADPLFVSASDWHLQAGSPCINAGTNDLVVGETDFYGDARVVGGCVDMGASEFRQASGYAAWAAENNLGAADAVTEGQPNLIRYVFDRPSGAFSPFTGLTFQDGDPVVWFQSFNPDVSDVSLSILSTTNLLDWTHAVEFQLPGPPFDFGGIILQHADTAPARFFKLKAR